MQTIGVVSGPQAKAVVENAIHKRMGRTTAVLERALSSAPDDLRARSRALGFPVEGVPVTSSTPGGRLLLEVNGSGISRRFGIHPHALGQMAERVGMPGRYASDLAGGACWQVDLLAEIFGRSFREVDGSWLVRSVDGQARGFLSSAYKPIDVRPVLSSIVGALDRIGAVCYEAVASDLRVSVRALQPEPFEIAPGEWVCLGVDWANTDFGGTANAVSLFVLRALCLNGMTGQTVLRQVHLGARQEVSGVEWSGRTRRLEVAADKSRTADVVQAVLSPEAVEERVAALRASAEKATTWAEVERSLRGKLGKGDLEAVRAVFEGPDVVNVPPGANLWRASNAVSWLARSAAQDGSDTDRVLDLERAAGSLLPESTVTVLG